MHIYNNLDARRAVLKVFGDRARHSIHTIDKTGSRFSVRLKWAPYEPIPELPEGVVARRDKDYLVVIFERRDVEL